jgi:ankyrin repeat protein
MSRYIFYKRIKIDVYKYVKETVVKGHSKITYLLIYYGVKPSYDDNALINIACRYGSIQVVKMLLHLVKARECDVEIAIANGHISIVKILIYYVQLNNNVMYHAKTFNMFKFLERIGGDIHQENDELLTIAIYRRDITIVKYLLKPSKHTNINAWDGQALIIATEQYQVEIVKVLLDHGANPALQSQKALIVALKNRFYNIVDLLIKYGANPLDQRLLESNDSSIRKLVEDYFVLSLLA